MEADSAGHQGARAGSGEKDQGHALATPLLGLTSSPEFEGLWTLEAGSSLRRELRVHWLAAHSRCTGIPWQPMSDSHRQGGGAPLG